MSGEFARRVYVRAEGGVRPLAGLADAIKLLSEHVGPDVSKRQQALDACTGAIEGRMLTPLARRAIVSALLEARMLASD